MSTEKTIPHNVDNTQQPPASSPQMLRVLPAEAIMEQAGGKPSIELPGDNRLISEYATELGDTLHDAPLFLRNGEVVRFDQDTARILPIRPQEFRTQVEMFCAGYKFRGEEKTVATVSMSNDIAQAVLVSPHFTSRLRGLRRVNQCQQPVLRSTGKIELLPTGYDEATQTLTLEGVSFASDMSLAEAVEALRFVFSGFCFVDAVRALAVVIAGMLGLFAQGLLPSRSLRPCFIVLANGEGAGKTLLVKLMIFPTLGSVAVGSRPEREEEIEKVLLTSVREGKLVLFLDNLKGHLASPRIEAFLSSEVWRGRILGHSASYEAENLATTFITGNGLTVSPDMRRRSLFTELHLAVERAEDRQFGFELNDKAMVEKRPGLLAALWALVRNWDAAGRPPCNRSHSGFPAWAGIIGGIVEAAGLGCCLDSAQIAAAADQDGDDMRRLVQAMAEATRTSYTFNDLLHLALELGCFENIVGVGSQIDTDLAFEKKMTPAQCSRLGRLLARYDKRQIQDCHFVVSGKGHSRRYSVTRLNVAPANCTVETHEADVQEPPRPLTKFQREIADD